MWFVCKESGGSYCKWICVRTLDLILFRFLQAEETYLSAGAESARERTTSPQCSFGPPCPLWGCLLAEAAGKPWQPGWHSACHNPVSSLCLALLGIQEIENEPSDIRCPCPQRINILKYLLFCPCGGRKGLRVDKVEVQLPWYQDILGRKGRQSKVRSKTLELSDALRSLNIPALAKWRGKQR